MPKTPASKEVLTEEDQVVYGSSPEKQAQYNVKSPIMFQYSNQ